MPPPVRNRFALAQSRINIGKQAVVVEGLDVLMNAMRAAPGELEKAFRRDLKKIVEPVKQSAQANVASGSADPTGRLAASIKIRTSTRGRRIGARVGSSLVYAPVREFGRQRTLTIAGRAPAVQRLKPGRFFMRAIEQHRAGITPKVERLVDRTLDQVFAAANVERVV